MKRATLFVVSTVAGLYLILTYQVPAVAIKQEAGAQAAPDAAVATGPPDQGIAGGDTQAQADPTGDATAPTASTALTAARSKTRTTVQATANAAGAADAGATTGTATQRTIQGPVATTKYGPVQVSITVQGTKIVGASALQVPTGGLSDSINAMAVPKLKTQTLQAQSANVTGVSGATYTTGGWKQSLQGALAQI